MPDLPAVPGGSGTGPPVRPPGPTGSVAPIPEPRSAAEDLVETIWELTLYVTGATMRSARAITFVRQLCDVHLQQRHRLTVIDVSDAVAEVPPIGVLAAPSLVRRHPLPERRWYGDLSDADRVLVGLQITTPIVAPATHRTVG